MKIQTKAVHSGDRKPPIGQVSSATPIHLATTYLCEDTAQLDRLLGHEESGFCYSRFGNPTTQGFEEVVTALEGGHGTLACASGMAAIHVALMAALTDRPKSILAANALYGATVNLLLTVLAPLGIDVSFVDVCDLAAVEAALQEHRPAALLLETMSNPLLRVGALDRIAELCRATGTALVVDSTFATPVVVRPMELGAHFVIHSATKYLAGHGDVLGGTVTYGEEHHDIVRALGRAYGPSLGPFESYLAMRGVKTLPLRMERQCANACRIASWLATHPRIERVHFTGDPRHPDAATIARLFPPGLQGAMVSFEIRDADKSDVFRVMDCLRLVVRGTSLGDVHTMVLYPTIASHRDLAPKQRQRLGIGDNLLRLSAGIEAPEDILADLDQALAR